MEKRFKEVESIYFEQVLKKFCCILLENFDDVYNICVKLVFSQLWILCVIFVELCG